MSAVGDMSVSPDSGISGRRYRSDGVHGRLVHELGRRIVTGRLAPGEVLPTEAALVEELGSGRSAVREAVKVLTAKGLVRTRTKVGTVVQPEAAWNLLDPDVLAWRYQAQPAGYQAQATGYQPTGKQLDDLTGLRIALEPQAARLAARARDRTGIAAIGHAYLRMTGTIDDPDAFIGHDLAFHRAITEAAGNLLLSQLSDLLAVALEAARQVHTRNVRRNRRTLPAHKAVLDAITGRDADLAEELMRKLVTGAQHDIRRDLSQRHQQAS